MAGRYEDESPARREAIQGATLTSPIPSTPAESCQRPAPSDTHHLLPPLLTPPSIPLRPRFLRNGFSPRDAADGYEFAGEGNTSSTLSVSLTQSSSATTVLNQAL